MTVSETKIRQLFSLILLLIVIGAIYGLLVLPLQKYYENRQVTIASLQKEYRDYYSISLAREELEKEAKNISGLRNQQGYFLKSENNALAAAELQTYVKKAIENAGGRLLSTQPIPITRPEILHPVQVRVRMQGSMDVLQQTLYSLETGKPTVILDNVELSHVNVSKQYGRKMTNTAISISFDIIGFIRNS